MKSWNNCVNQRWLRIILATAVLISLCIFLGSQNYTMYQALEKIPVPKIMGSTPPLEIAEPLPLEEITIVTSSPKTPVTPEPPEDVMPPDNTMGQASEETPIPEITEPEPPAEITESEPQTEITESEPQTEITESEPQTEITESEPQEEITESEPSPETVESAPSPKKPGIPEPPEYVLAPKKTSGNRKEKLAYMTFLSGTADSDGDMEKDKYFIAVRILVWQLVHNPETRTEHDVIVMVTPKVSQSRRDRLKKDGAIVYPVEFLHTPNDGWLHPNDHRWDDVMTKMRAWELTQYDRVLMMDGDSMLVRSLDPVFDDPAGQLLATKPSNDSTLPSTYLVASNSEVWNSHHDFPPTAETGLKKPGYMNAGFVMLAPSLAAFEHYKSLIDTPHSFDSKYPEQNLINFVHRWDGPMPWRELSYKWNLRCPNDKDFELGLYSVHEKWWEQPFIYDNEKTKQWIQSRRWEMKGWYDAWDRIHEEAILEENRGVPVL